MSKPYNACLTMVVFNGITLQKYMFDIKFCVSMFCFTLVCIWIDFVDNLSEGLPAKRVLRCAFAYDKCLMVLQ